MIKWKLHETVDTGYGYQKGRGLARPVEERVPIAAQDAPALSPLYNPKHRWVFLPDMDETEAVVFKVSVSQCR